MYESIGNSFWKRTKLYLKEYFYSFPHRHRWRRFKSLSSGHLNLGISSLIANLEIISFCYIGWIKRNNSDELFFFFYESFSSFLLKKKWGGWSWVSIDWCCIGIELWSIVIGPESLLNLSGMIKFLERKPSRLTLHFYENWWLVFNFKPFDWLIDWLTYWSSWSAIRHYM